MSRAAHLDPEAYAGGLPVYPPSERMPHRDSRYALTTDDNEWTEHGFDMAADAAAGCYPEGDE